MIVDGHSLVSNIFLGTLMLAPCEPPLFQPGDAFGLNSLQINARSLNHSMTKCHHAARDLYAKIIPCQFDLFLPAAFVCQPALGDNLSF
jgi:hypothetical protein